MYLSKVIFHMQVMSLMYISERFQTIPPLWVTREFNQQQFILDIIYSYFYEL